MPKTTAYPRLRTHVRKGKDGKVWVSYSYDHRGHDKPDEKLGTDREAALKRWAEIHLDGPRQTGTLEEAFRAWELADDGLLDDKRSAETIKGYRKCLAAMRPALQHARWEDVTLPTLAGYIKARSAKTRGRQEMQVLSVVWGWARLHGLTALVWPAVGMQRSGWKGKPGTRQVEVEDKPFAALHKHADQCLKDALDIATATGLRVTDVLSLRLSDVRDGKLIVTAGKTGKRAEFDLAESAILGPIIERRRAMRGVEHVFLLAAGKKPVTYRRLSDRFVKARASASAECPEVSALWLRDMRKRAAQLSTDLESASKLLQHSSLSVTQRHYRQGDKINPVR